MSTGKKISIFVCLLLTVCVIVFVLYHTSWGTDNYKTFYVTDANYNIYSGVDDETIPVTSGKKFNVRYSLSKKTGYTAKVYSYVTEDNVFGYTVDGERMSYTTDIDVSEQFQVKTGGKSFTIVMPENMQGVIKSLYPDKAVTLTEEADITKTAYFKLVVTSEDGEKQTIIRLKGKPVGYLNSEEKAPPDENTPSEGNQGTHVHVFSEVWTYDSYVHFHMAICGCGHDVVKDKSEHTYDGNICTVCGYEREEPSHVHTYDTSKWYTNGAEHWHEATCGHYLKTDIGNHSYSYGNCEICGYDGGFDFDSTTHWRDVTYDVGGNSLLTKEDWNDHTYDSNGRCTVCGYSADGGSGGGFGGGGGSGRSVNTGN